MVSFAEALEVHDLTRPQELERLAHIRVVDQAQQVVVGRAGLLLCCQIFKQVGDRVALALQRRRRKRDARRGLRVDAGRMVDEVGVEAALLDLFGRQVARQLVDDRGDHLLMGELFCTYLRVKMAPRANGCLPSAGYPAQHPGRAGTARLIFFHLFTARRCGQIPPVSCFFRGTMVNC